MRCFSVSIITTLHVFGVVTAAPVMISFSDPNGKWPESNHPQPGGNAPHHSVASSPRPVVPIASRPPGINLAQHHVANFPRPPVVNPPQRPVAQPAWRTVVNRPPPHVANAPQHQYPLRLGIEDGADHPSPPHSEHGSTSDLQPVAKPVWRTVVNPPRPHVANAPGPHVANAPQHQYPLRLGIEDGAEHPSPPDSEHGSTSNWRPVAKPVWRPVVNPPRSPVANAPQNKYPSRIGVEDGAEHSSHPNPQHGSTSDLKRKQPLNLSPNRSSKHPKTNF